MGNVLAGGSQERRGARNISIGSAAAKFGAALGFGLVIVGVVDLAILWTPFRFGTPGWEFATVSRTFTNMPMITLGVLMGPAAMGYVLGGWRRREVQVLGVTYGVMALLLVAGAVLYGLSTVAVWQLTPPEGQSALSRALLKNGVEMVVYTGVLALASVVYWRLARQGLDSRRSAGTQDQ